MMVFISLNGIILFAIGVLFVSMTFSYIYKNIVFVAISVLFCHCFSIGLGRFYSMCQLSMCYVSYDCYVSARGLFRWL